MIGESVQGLSEAVARAAVLVAGVVDEVAEERVSLAVELSAYTEARVEPRGIGEQSRVVLCVEVVGRAGKVRLRVANGAFNPLPKSVALHFLIGDGVLPSCADGVEVDPTLGELDHSTASIDDTTSPRRLHTACNQVFRLREIRNRSTRNLE